MNSIDLLGITTANPKRLLELAAQYGVKQSGPEGYWQARREVTNPFTHEVVRIKISSRLTNLREALLKLIPMVEARIAEARSERAPVLRVREGATLGQVFALYRTAPAVRANEETRERNIADLARMVRAVHGEIDVEQAGAALVEWELGERYQREAIAAAAVRCRGNNLALDAAKRAANSTLKHAQSLFAKPALAAYRALGLPATVREFADVLPIPVAEAPKPKPLGDLVSVALERVDGLRETRPAVWAAFQLMLRAGLRNVEALHARRSWLAEEPGGWRLTVQVTAEFRPKGNEGSVVLPAEVGAALVAISASGAATLSGESEAAMAEKANPHLVPGTTATARHDAVYRDLNAWLKGLGVGVESGKVAYRLRKEFGRRVLEQQRGRIDAEARSLAAAREALRHAPGSAVTEQHYVGDAAARAMAEPVRF